ncbi:hypothetical protein GJ496_008068 [Pomphorhynchus laevis]|nr:hypothetical protein GJ496_008068 [Pomphorhynchus laevis]
MYNKSVVSELSKKINEFTDKNDNLKIEEMQLEESINDIYKHRVTFQCKKMRSVQFIVLITKKFITPFVVLYRDRIIYEFARKFTGIYHIAFSTRDLVRQYIKFFDDNLYELETIIFKPLFASVKITNIPTDLEDDDVIQLDRLKGLKEIRLKKQSGVTILIDFVKIPIDVSIVISTSNRNPSLGQT